jgi:peptidyl-prolyl cis-trans isomerase SurA
LKNEKISWENAIFQNSTNPIGGGIIFNQSSGDMYWDMKNIDKSLFIGINNLEIGQYSEPIYYEDEKGNIGYRILKLLDQTKPHLANLNDDYGFVQKYAVNQKQINEMDKWVTKTAKNTYIKIEEMYRGCPNITKWNIKF